MENTAEKPKEKIADHYHFSNRKNDFWGCNSKVCCLMPKFQAIYLTID
jgi:hypothetical protein